MTIVLSIAAAIASYTTTANNVAKLNDDVKEIREDIKTFTPVRERTIIVETELKNFGRTLTQIAEDVKSLIETRRNRDTK